MELEVQEFCNLSDDFVISRSTAEGTKLEHYTPSLITYEVRSAKLDGERLSCKVTGTLVVFDNHLQASIQLRGKQWELAPAMRPEKREGLVEEYVLFDVAKSAATNTFTCAVEDQEREMQRMGASQRNSLVPQCVEIGLDVDNFTYNTFGDCYQAIDWALGVLAGVDLVYRTELNDFITLQASYVNVWETRSRGPTLSTMPARCWINSRRMGLLQSRVVQCQLGPCPFDVQARRHWNRRHCLPQRGLQSLISEWAFQAPWTTNPTFLSSLPISHGTSLWLHMSWATILDPTTPTGVDGLVDLTTRMNRLDRLAPFMTVSIRKVAAWSPSSMNRAPS